MSEGESTRKQCAQLIVNRNKFKFVEIELQSPRVMIHKDIFLHDIIDEVRDAAGRFTLPSDHTAKVQHACNRKLAEMLIMARNERKEKYPKSLGKPLGRLRLMAFHQDFQQFNLKTFNRKWKELGYFANDDVLMIKTTGKRNQTKAKGFEAINLQEVDKVDLKEQLMKHVNEELKRQKESAGGKVLQLLDQETTVKFISDCLDDEFASKHLKGPIKELINMQYAVSCDRMTNQQGLELTEDMDRNLVDLERLMLSELNSRQDDWKNKNLDDELDKFRKCRVQDVIESSSSSSVEEIEEPPKKRKTASTRGRGRPRTKK